MQKRESLRAYQDQILVLMEQARLSDANQAQLLFGFSAAKMNFLISGKDVTEVAAATKLEPVPIAKAWVCGAANVKGSVQIVTDFSVLMGGEPLRRGKFILLSPDVMPGAALYIERLTGLFDQRHIGSQVEDQRLKGMPQWVVSCFEIGGEHHYLVDAKQLASDHRFSKSQSGEI